MLNFRRSLLVASLLSVAFVVTQPAESIAQTASFQGLGDLPGGRHLQPSSWHFSRRLGRHGR